MALVSLEMSEEQYGIRALSSLTGIPMERIVAAKSLSITRDNMRETYKALFGDTRPDPEITPMHGGSMIEVLDDIHGLTRDVMQMVVELKHGLGIETNLNRMGG